MMNIILAITFLFGPLRFLTFTKIFDNSLLGLVQLLLPVTWENLNKRYIIDRLIMLIDTLSLYGSLCFHIWYWLFR